MLDRLAHEAGLSVSELAPGLCYKTAHYHVRRLTEAGLVVPVRRGGRVFCYLAGDGRRRAPRPWAVAALRAIAAGAGSPAGLSRTLGVPRGTAGGMLRRLERESLLVRAGERWALSAGVEAFIGVEPLAEPWNARSSAR